MRRRHGVVLAMLMSCTHPHTTHVRVPTSDAAAQGPAARTCVAACPRTTGSYACYLACPGAFELEGPCTKDRSRDNACVHKTESSVNGGRINATVAGVVILLLLVPVVWYVVLDRGPSD